MLLLPLDMPRLIRLLCKRGIYIISKPTASEFISNRARVTSEIYQAERIEAYRRIASVEIDSVPVKKIDISYECANYLFDKEKKTQKNALIGTFCKIKILTNEYVIFII